MNNLKIIHRGCNLCGLVLWVAAEVDIRENNEWISSLIECFDPQLLSGLPKIFLLLLVRQLMQLVQC
jgi:hypothetical protein